MIGVIYLTIGISFILIQSFTIIIYMTRFLQRRVSLNFLFPIILGIDLVAHLSVSSGSAQTTTWQTNYRFFIFLAIIFFFFFGKLLKKFFHYIFLSYLIFTQNEILLLLTKTEHTLLHQLLIELGLSIIILLIVLSINLLVYFKTANWSGLENKEYFLLSIIPAFSIFLMIDQPTHQLQQILKLIIILVINLTTIRLYDQLSRKNFLLQAKMVNELLDDYYRLILKTQKQTTKLRHNLKNILLELIYYLNKNDVSAAKNYLTSILNASTLNQNQLTGCGQIDAILAPKIELLKEKHIAHTFKAQIPSDLDVSKIILDIAIILGNLIDNAIEESLRLPHHQHVKISLSYQKETLFFYISNRSHPKNINLEAEATPSEKNNGRQGLGLSSVKESVKKLNGYLSLSHNDSNFKALIILPIRLV